MSASAHPNSWPALGALAGGDPRKLSIAWNLATLLLEPCGSSEDYASTVQQHCDAERALVQLGAPEGENVVAWARAELARDTSDDLVDFEVLL